MKYIISVTLCLLVATFTYHVSASPGGWRDDVPPEEVDCEELCAEYHAAIADMDAAVTLQARAELWEEAAFDAWCDAFNEDTAAQAKLKKLQTRANDICATGTTEECHAALDDVDEQAAECDKSARKLEAASAECDQAAIAADLADQAWAAAEARWYAAENAVYAAGCDCWNG